MINESIKRVDAANLRTAGRKPETPFRLVLDDGADLVLQRLLRVLPGKRIVGVGEWKGRRVLAKLFIAGGSARHWAQEKDGIKALHQADIPTPGRVLASPLPAGGHVLLKSYLENARSLAEAWGAVSPLPEGSSAALDVLRPAFRLIGTMHAAGLVQEDLHLGNFLCGGDRLFVIDGDAVRAIAPGGRLDEQRATSNLAVLLAQLPTAWNESRDELLDAYQAGGGGQIPDKAFLERELTRVRAWRMSDFLAKTVRDCTLFAVKHTAFRFLSVCRKEADQLFPLLDSLDDAILQGYLLKDGRTSTVAKVEQANRSLVIKRYNLKSLAHALERFWRPTRAWHSWREGHRLRFLGIPTPEPLALVEERFGPFRRRAFLINEYCPGINLINLLSPEQPPAEEVAKAILSLFQSLHDQRISHGDLKATNLLWHEGRVFVIDLDAVVQHRSASAFGRAWRRDRARFLRNWPASSVLYRWLDENLPLAGGGDVERNGPL